jgi:hypothetical protein
MPTVDESIPVEKQKAPMPEMTFGEVCAVRYFQIYISSEAKADDLTKDPDVGRNYR